MQPPSYEPAPARANPSQVVTLRRRPRAAAAIASALTAAVILTTAFPQVLWAASRR